MGLPPCPNELPSCLSSLIQGFGRAWAASAVRPSPALPVVEHWSLLLQEWAGAGDMPLFVRKSGNRGSIIRHESGRALVICDNSPAQWAYSMACRAERPSLEMIRELLRSDGIPVAMMLKSEEKHAAHFRCTLAQQRQADVNRLGWKLAHIDGVGLRSRVALGSFPMERLVRHFVALLSPSNMFVVPEAWAGIAEVEGVVSEIRSWVGSFDRQPQNQG